MAWTKSFRIPKVKKPEDKNKQDQFDDKYKNIRKRNFSDRFDKTNVPE